MKNIIIYTLSIICVFSCGRSAKTSHVAESSKEFRMAAIPVHVSSPEAIAEYIAYHYWDNFDFTDTSYIDLPEVTEQAFANYVAVLMELPDNLARISIKNMLGEAEKDTGMFIYFTELYDKYLYDPNSPFLNEELYIPVLEIMINTGLLSDMDKVRPQYRYDMAMKNRAGTPAADFKYTTIDGSSGTLYKIKSEYTLLFINNPGCSACKEIIRDINLSPVINRRIESGGLTILGVYPDNNLNEWREYAEWFPNTWINSHDTDKSMDSLKLYDLRSIPTLYLLDSDKTVLLKDALLEAVEDYLIRN
ncbi:MAG: DUF5106 domain-containing protein [Rikenellaceae bacterium]|nr:DUF5106 domain-containing protein [Rikenellaceae bacterium]